MICFSSLGLRFCMFKMHVRLLNSRFEVLPCFCVLRFCLVFVFLGFPGKNLRMHNLACVRKLDYVHAGLFLCVQVAAQKP